MSVSNCNIFKSVMSKIRYCECQITLGLHLVSVTLHGQVAMYCARQIELVTLNTIFSAVLCTPFSPLMK